MSDYYWTAFCNHRIDPNTLHCTHKFLGGISAEQANQVAGIIGVSIGLQRPKAFTVGFSTRAYFGEADDIPVLIAADGSEFSRFSSLRLELDAFREDDYVSYCPHVTTELEELKFTMNQYVLMRGKQIVKTWEFPEAIKNAGKTIELHPVVGNTVYFEKAVKAIRLQFRKLLFEPLLEALELPPDTIQNAKRTPLLDAIRKGTITFSDGVFTGKLSAEITKELRKLGATWDAKAGTFTFRGVAVPAELQRAAELSQANFQASLAKAQAKLSQNLPETIAGSIDLTKIFDSSIWATDREIGKTLKGLSLPPKLTTEQRERIALEWQKNAEIWIKNFAESEIESLRKTIQARAFKGDRYGSAVKAIQKSYGVTAAKAKFLARQETSLLLAKFKEVRYTEANVLEYRWKTVVGSAAHPVRPSHKILDGKIFKWSDPPITTAPGEPARRNNPGQDYNCRCHAIPIVKFAKS